MIRNEHLSELASSSNHDMQSSVHKNNIIATLLLFYLGFLPSSLFLILFGVLQIRISSYWVHSPNANFEDGSFCMLWPLNF